MEKKDMIYQNDKKSFKRFLKSFKYCYQGMKYAFYHEQNIMVMLIVAIIVLVMGMVLPLTYVERLVVLVIVAVILSMEMINTAIEATVDLVTTKENKLAKVAKDSSSAAVGIMAVFSVIIGILIFVPKIMDLF